MPKRTLVTALFFASLILLVSAPRVEADAVISLGTPIPIDANTFALPIEITGAVELTSWSLGLNYNPTDVQINTGCDSSGVDQFCSFLTGPFTEGDFFASGAPFNLLVPGVIELGAPGSNPPFDQTGVMFGFNGAYQGFPPAPSGDGTLAYIEFTLLGDGDSPITITNPVTTSSAVPEPGTLILLTSGLALLAARRLAGRRRRDRF